MFIIIYFFKKGSVTILVTFMLLMAVSSSMETYQHDYEMGLTSQRTSLPPNPYVNYEADDYDKGQEDDNQLTYTQRSFPSNPDRKSVV